MLKNKPFLLKIAFLAITILPITGCWETSSKEGMSAPIIKHLEWGKMIISQDGRDYQYNDCKLWPEKSKEWNWKETGTHHVPGIQIADLQEFIDKVDVVILSQGMDLILQVPQQTIDYVKNKGKECHVGQTKDMADLYNKLVKEGKKVGGLFHSTC